MIIAIFIPSDEFSFKNTQSRTFLDIFIFLININFILIILVVLQKILCKASFSNHPLIFLSHVHRLIYIVYTVEKKIHMYTKTNYNFQMFGLKLLSEHLVFALILIMRLNLWLSPPVAMTVA